MGFILSAASHCQLTGAVYQHGLEGALIYLELGEAGILCGN